MKSQPFSYLQKVVALGLIAFGAVLIMTGTVLIAVIVATAVLMVFFAKFLFGKRQTETTRKKRQTKTKGGTT